MPAVLAALLALSAHAQDTAQPVAPSVPRAVADLTLEELIHQQCSHPAGSEHLKDVILQDGRTFRVKLTCRF